MHQKQPLIHGNETSRGRRQNRVQVVRRRTGTLIAAAALALTGCSEGAAEPDVPEDGPLNLNADGPTRCIEAPAHEFVAAAALAVNTADIPLTIDAVDLTGTENLLLVDAMLQPVPPDAPGEEETPAVDATMGELEAPDGDRMLLLRLRRLDPSAPARYTSVQVDYHNVEGEYRAVGDADVTLTGRCP
jgi:hypothetical protein